MRVSPYLNAAGVVLQGALGLSPRGAGLFGLATAPSAAPLSDAIGGARLGSFGSQKTVSGLKVPSAVFLQNRASNRASVPTLSPRASLRAQQVAAAFSEPMEAQSAFSVVDHATKMSIIEKLAGGLK